jgi:4-amino-4-deoxy-L-arabinose transferase-like glycosyltransferase
VAHDFADHTIYFFNRRTLSVSARAFAWLAWGGIVAALFYHLGGAVLFEPDEGRNAEKAREILVLQDWLTPHENFHAVLDKPIFFYWLIALAYKVFGISEWAARLPSALAALGTLALVYRFARVSWGRWTALWSVLILLTSVEFFVLARIVIFDMTLTFFLTMALCAFFEASHSEVPMQRRLWCAAMYAALGAATLIKGLIGVVVPGMVIFFYLLLTKRWATLKRLALLPGAVLFLAIVLSWYLPVEVRNPGYLQYYFWEEHFGRFVTTEFDRGEPWYYFIGVAFVGFLPWTLLVPLAVKTQWQAFTSKKLDDKTLYLILWAVVPLVFFSISKSKLPHYILPIFPAVALLTAATLPRLYQDAPKRARFALSLTWWMLFLVALFFVVGWFFPPASPRQIRAAVSEMGYWVWCFAVVSGGMLVYTAKRHLAGSPPSQGRLYALQAASLAVFLALVVQMMVLISPSRSAEAVIAAVKPKLRPETRVVFYDTYFAGALFYLRSERPLLLVTHETKKQTFMGNFYALGNAEHSPISFSETILSFQEFQSYWQSTGQSLLIIVKEKNLPRMAKSVGEMPARLGAIDEYLLVTKP